MLRSMIIYGSLQLGHGLSIVLLLSFFDSLSLALESGLNRVYLSSEIGASFLDFHYFNTCLFFRLFALFDVFVNVILIDLELLSEIFHTLALRLKLLLPADVILHEIPKSVY